ncbi:MAG: CHASE2 domain-containing protein [Ignavibacterium sp.]|nr:CHASE2 domain-containing protein [Ignavibacterium sp.]
MLRDKKVIKILVWQGTVLWFLCSYIQITIVKEGTRADHHLNDYLMNFCRENFDLFPNSEQIVYLTINDKTYNEYFKENTFNRKLFSESLYKLKKYDPEAIILDLIFAYPSDPVSDSVLAQSLSEFNNVYLPVSFSLLGTPVSSRNLSDLIQSSSIKRSLGRPETLNQGNPLITGRSVLTDERFLSTASGSGHISEQPDEDGIYRHSILVIKVDSTFLPALYLSAYLDYVNLSADDLIIEWGKNLVLPKLAESWLNEDIKIPIDKSGRTRIPFVDIWAKDFQNLSLNTFNKMADQPDKQGQLLSFFEGKFVFVGDVSTGIADIGTTSLSQNSPLLNIQANMLNALLTKTFMKGLSNTELAILLFIVLLLLTVSTFFADIKIFYLAFIVLIILLNITIGILAINYIILPIISVNSFFILSFVLLIIQVHYFTQRDKKFAEIENLKKEHEMIEAKKIQLSMLPSSLPKLDSIDIETYMSTAALVGGDYYDFFIDEDGILKFVIADATGHGLKAGTMVTVVKTLFINIREKLELGTALNQMSSIIKKLHLPKLYVCISLFRYKDYELEFTSAGMPPVIIIRAQTSQIETIVLKGMPLGHVENFPYDVRQIDLNPGDILLICSDGLTELFNPQNEMIDPKLISDTLKNNANLTPKEILDSIINLIKCWSASIEPRDDITLILIKVK